MSARKDRQGLPNPNCLHPVPSFALSLCLAGAYAALHAYCETLWWRMVKLPNGYGPVALS